MTLTEIAARITAHLKRFESEGTDKFLCSRAWVYRQCVRVQYFGSTHLLTRAEAEAYLAWLDAGGVGKHWEMQDASTHNP